MPKRATAVILSEKEQEGLLQITKRHRSEQQVVLRARIVLLAAQGSGNADIARELGAHVDTVRLWRCLWGGRPRGGPEPLCVRQPLQNGPRARGKAQFSSGQHAPMGARACGAPTPT